MKNDFPSIASGPGAFQKGFLRAGTTVLVRTILAILVLLFAAAAVPAQSAPSPIQTPAPAQSAPVPGHPSSPPQQLLDALRGPFDLSAPRVPAILHFLMETRVVHIGFDGKRTGVETMTQKLKCVPGALSSPPAASDEYTCAEFRLQIGDGPAATIPALAGWTYRFSLGEGTGIDASGQVFGIPHAKFEELVDSRGAKLPPALRYFVYNTFIDFHGFHDVFPRPIPGGGGGGVQDLTAVGQRIVHASAFTAPPVNLGSGIKEGSYFKNGEVTLEFKGLTVVDGAACAILAFDSGESTLKMIMPLGADKEIVTTGGSTYRGDIYIDLATRWVRKVALDESVVSQTVLPGPAPKMDAYVIRHLLLRLISASEFEQK